MEHKVAVLIVLTIIGIVASVIGVFLGSTLAGFIGAGIIFGELINGIVSWVFLGNEFFSDEMLTDMLIGGIAGLISSFFGLIAGAGVANTSFVSWLSTRIPWLGRAFPKMFGGGIAGGVDQSLWDLLKEGKVNWKKAAVATGLGFLLVFGGEAIHSNSNKIINWINNRNISYATEIFADGTASAPKTVGDTKFGQWLQKFAAQGGNNSNIIKPISTRGTCHQLRREFSVNGVEIRINSGHGYNRTHHSGSVQSFGTMDEIDSAIVNDIVSKVKAGYKFQSPPQKHVDIPITVNGNKMEYRVMYIDKIKKYNVVTYFP